MPLKRKGRRSRSVEKKTLTSTSKRGFAALYAHSGGLAAHALAYAEELRLPLPDEPLDERGRPMRPELPPDITKLSTDQLGRLYGQFAAVEAYANAHLGMADVAETDWETQHDLVDAQAGLQAEGKNRDERAYVRKLDAEVVKKRQTALAKRARRVFLASLVKGYERSITTISREYSRRGIEREHSYRG